MEYQGLRSKSQVKRGPLILLLLQLFILLVFLMILSGDKNVFVKAVDLPGVQRRYYGKGDKVQVKTRKLSSIKNLPFDFYSLKFCRPDPIIHSAENLGEYMFGDRIENSVFKLNFLEEVSCKPIKTCQDDICSPKVVCPDIQKSDINDFIHLIEEDYIAQLIIDNLPVANRQDSSRSCGSLPSLVPTEEKVYSRPDGYPIGCKSPPETEKIYYLNNHLTFTIKYHLYEDNRMSIVGAEVIPSSIAYQSSDQCKIGSPLPRELPKLQLKDSTNNVLWTYSVHWEKSDIRYSSRWDAYISTADNEEYKIHWFSIINSIIIVIFLTAMVAMILARVLHKDIAYYNRTEEDVTADETGWKLVHGDVFRSPKFYTLLSVLSGSGVQVFCMALITIIFSLLGLLSPTNRGLLMTMMVLFFILMGFVAGFITLKLYKMFGGKRWLLVSLLTTFFLPGLVFNIFVFINFIIWVFAHSSGAVPFLTLLSAITAWFVISVPLVLLGSFFGFKQDTIKHPVQVQKIPRQIPDQPFYMRAPVAALMGGILPFGTVFIESYFIMSSLWLHKFYYVFGFLFIVFCILIVTCAEITIVMIYFQLCSENYLWWWRSFFTSGSSSFYLFLYAVFYFFTKLHIDSFLMGVLFFGYTSIICIFMFVFTGSIGFFACLWFIRKIYGSIKVE